MLYRNREQADFGAMYPGVEDHNVSLLEHVRRAAARLDLDECLRFVTWANEHESEAVVAPLSVVIEKPAGRKTFTVWRRQPWVDMRAGAVRVLGRTGLATASPALAYALMHDSYDVQTLAMDALEKLGARTVPALLASIQHSRDWPLEGMLRTIRALAHIKQPIACPVLIYILTAQTPRTPARWDRAWLQWSLGIGSIIGLWLAASVDSAWQIEPFVCTLVALILGSSAACAVPVGIVIEKLKSRESAIVRAAAVDAVISIRDPLSVPGLIDAATGRFRIWARRAALKALVEVLPALGPEHLGLLGGAAERKFTGLLSMNNTKLSLVVLHALEFVGTGQSVRVIERYIRNGVACGYGGIKAAVKEAERILPVLQERRSQEQAPGMLLRPSHASDDIGDRLLRPAYVSARDSQEAELLRPSDKVTD